MPNDTVPAAPSGLPSQTLTEVNRPSRKPFNLFELLCSTKDAFTRPDMKERAMLAAREQESFVPEIVAAPSSASPLWKAAEVMRAETIAGVDRRGALAALAGAGTALSLPKTVRAASAITNPDAALIAAARRVGALAMLEARASARCYEIEPRFMAALPPHPGEAKSAFQAAYAAALREASLPLHPTPEALAQAFKDAAEYARQTAGVAHAAKLAAHDAVRERLRHETGLARAERLADYLDSRLDNAAEALAAMRAATPAGIAAKARAMLAIREAGWEDCTSTWIEALSESIVRDAATLGGAA